MNRRHRLQSYLILLLVPFMATSCIFFQREEGDKHPDYPDILKRNDSLDLALKPLAISNNSFYTHQRSTDSIFSEEIPSFDRVELDGRFVYIGSKAKTSLYYDNTGKLIKKSKRSPDINRYGQFFEQEDSVFYLFDFYTEKPVDTIQTVISIINDRYTDAQTGCHIIHKELLKEIPAFPPQPKREQYAHDTLFYSAKSKYFDEMPKMIKKYLLDLHKSNEVYELYNNDGKYSYYILPQKKIAIAIDESYPDYRTENFYAYNPYVQFGQLASHHLYKGQDFQLKETESVVHSLYDCGGRGNIFLYQCERRLYYYDFMAEGDTLHFKSFSKLNLVEVTKVGDKYIITLGGHRYEAHKDLYYFFEYTPKAHRKAKQGI